MPGRCPAMHAFLFHNPAAGEGDWPQQRLLDAVRNAGIEPVYRCIKQDGWSDGLTGAPSLVLIAGGDGTVDEVAVRLHAALASAGETRIAILPTGGANNIARSLGAFASPAEALQGLSRAKTALLPLSRFVSGDIDRCTAEAVGLGALAGQESPRPPPRTREEKLRAGREALRRAVTTALPVAGRVFLDGLPIPEPVLAVEVLNVGTVGPRLPLAPGVETGDDRLTVAWLPAERRQAMLLWLEDPNSSPSPLSWRKGRRVALHLQDGPVRVADEKLPVANGQAVVKRQPGPLRVLVPGGR